MMRTIKAFKQDGKQGFTLKGRLNNLDSRYVFGIVFLQLIIFFFFGFFFTWGQGLLRNGVNPIIVRGMMTWIDLQDKGL
jgi:Fe2+ transport system protein B